MPPAVRLARGPDPSARTVMSQRMMRPPDHRRPSPESLESTGRQIEWVFVWATAYQPSSEFALKLTFKEWGGE